LSAKGDRRSGLNRWKWVGGNSPMSEWDQIDLAVMSAAQPLSPNEQTFAGAHRTAVSCQKPTYAVQQIAWLFDCLAGIR
jgi:hypothetical protein